jgi:hypothetical protein
MGASLHRVAAISAARVFGWDQHQERAMNAAVIRVRIPRIVREPDAPGWLVILGSYGWLFSSRHEALIACRDLTVWQ